MNLMRIFVSYTLRDRVLNPLLLADLDSLISQVGIPYIDILHNNSPHPQKYVMRMLNESSIFFACVTPLFHQSEWVRLELTTACRLGLPIIALDCRSLASSGNLNELRFNSEVAVALDRAQNIHCQDGTPHVNISAGLPMKFNLRESVTIPPL